MIVLGYLVSTRAVLVVERLEYMHLAQCISCTADVKGIARHSIKYRKGP